MITRSRLLVTAAVAAVALMGGQLVAAHGSAPGAAAPAAAPVVTLTNHYLRSGFITVNGTGQQVRFSTTNAETQLSLTIILSLLDSNGATVASTKGIVGPDKSLTLTYDPAKTTRVRAVFLTVGDTSLKCNGFAPSMEVLSTANGALHSIEVVDSFWHSDVPA